MSDTSPVPRSPVPRRVFAPRWLDVRLLLGVGLVLASVLIGAKVFSSASDTHAALAATHTLAAGTVLSADDVRVEQVRVPEHGGAQVYPRQVEDVVGKALRRPVSAGELLPSAALGTARARTTVTVPLSAAAAPQLRKGERIEIWLSARECGSLVLLPDVTVQAVRHDDTGSFSAGAGGQDVVISVSPQLADRVVQALAINEVQLRAGVLVGHASNIGPLPELARCSAAGSD